MDQSKVKRNRSRIKRAWRVRKKIRGTSARPRLSVSKTNVHLYVQLIDDVKRVSLGGIGTLSEPSKAASMKRKSKEAARYLGQQIAEIAKKQGVQTVVFDRGRHQYHGIIAELATAARNAGLQF